MNKLLKISMACLLIAGACLNAGSVVKADTNVFPEDCWGVYSWGGWNIKRVNRETHPLIKGSPMIFRWHEIEPEPGVFKFEEEIGQKLKEADENGFYTFLMIWVAPKAPTWLYENGVPELEMTPTVNPFGKPRDFTFQHYLDEDYVRYYHRMLREFCSYVKSLPPNLRDRILYIQSAEGSTGDGGPYKGKPLDLQYDITEEQWGDFRIEAWEVMKESLLDEDGKLIVPLLVNYDSNAKKQYDWVMQNLSVVGLKNGMFSHGYHISGTKTRIRNWRAFSEEVESAGKVFFSRGEQDGEYRIYGWSTQNIAQGLYWSAIFATHGGLDMWNVPWEACAGYENRDAIDFFNKYAGHRQAASSPAAFCALRKGLDASDVDAYPEDKFGAAEKRNIDRYLKIADAYSEYGAIQGDPEKAIGGGMLNRKRQNYNDVGWEIHDSNYERFLSQIDPESTTLGWWNRGPKESIYSRFSRSTDVKNGKNAFYFDLDDRFLEGTAPVEIKVVWLDEGSVDWSIRYSAQDGKEQTALSLKNTNTGEWKEASVVVSDFTPQNEGPQGADLFIQTGNSDDLVLHLVEVNRL